MRGIIASGAYLPYRRLDRSEIKAVFGKGGGSGTRAVASFDEDTTTMGVAAARNALSSTSVRSDALWFSTATPAYLEKTNATAIHAALGLAPSVGALDMGGATRSGVGALRTALTGAGSTLVVSADLRSGLPTSADEASGGDGAAAVLVGDDSDGPVVAEYVGGAVRTDEFTDRWRIPGSDRSRSWEERFGDVAYAPLTADAWAAALGDCDIDPGVVDHLVITGLNGRAVRRNAAELAVDADRIVDDLSASIGNTATAHPALLLCSVLERAGPAQTIALVVLADGVEVIVLRTTDAIDDWNATDPVVDQIEAGGPVSYGQFLFWRGVVAVEPPNRPAPPRPSSAAAHRGDDWKFGFVGSRDRSSGMVHMPPARVSEKGGAVDDMEQVPMADTIGTVASHTVDRLVHSPSPPVVFAVVDFDGGGRVPLELTDVDVADVTEGMRVEPTFRRLYTTDGIHNYFWKVRPSRVAGS